MSHQHKKFVYHFTSATNLESIREHGLLSRSEIRARGIRFKDVADQEILSHRGIFKLEQMVPFHFLPKTPFDYAVARASPEERFVLIAVYRTFAASKGWKIIPRHPLSDSETPDIMNWQDGFDQIDWHQMDRDDRDYDDHDCKMVCMAEALSPHTVQLTQVARVYVPTEQTMTFARRALGGDAGIRISVNVNMFPKGCL